MNINVAHISDSLQSYVNADERLAVQICVQHQNRLVLNEYYGSLEYSSGSPMLWMSAGKPLTAAIFLGEMNKRNLSLESRVSEVLPEFGQNGKNEITLFHLLTHTGGFRGADMGLNQSQLQEAVDHIYPSKLEPGWVPGKKAGYQINSSWIILAAIIEQLAEDTFEHVFDAFTASAGLSNTRCTRISVEDLVPIYDSSSEVIESAKRFETGFFQNIRPGSNITGPASDLALFYTHLLYAPEKLGLSKSLRDTMVSRQRTGMQDATFRAQMDWGLGVIKNQTTSSFPYGFGPHASENTVGHGGSQCSVGFMDPTAQLTGAVIFNDMPGEPVHQKRLNEVMRVIYETLELV